MVKDLPFSPEVSSTIGNSSFKDFSTRCEPRVGGSGSTTLSPPPPLLSSFGTLLPPPSSAVDKKKMFHVLVKHYRNVYVFSKCWPSYRKNIFVLLLPNGAEAASVHAAKLMYRFFLNILDMKISGTLSYISYVQDCRAVYNHNDDGLLWTMWSFPRHKNQDCGHTFGHRI